MKNKLIFIGFPILITTILFLLSKSSIEVTPLFFAQWLGLIGATLICITFLLTTRLSIFENMFGGQDKVYRVHRLISTIAFAAILNHPIMLALTGISLLKSLKLYFLPGAILSYNYGIFALYLLIALIFVTIVVNLPYHIWKITHKFMGLVLMLAFLHILTIESDVSRYLPLRIWMISLFTIAIASYLYTIYFKKFFIKTYKYNILKINIINDVVEVLFDIKNQKINFKPGQFIMLKFPDLGNEAHPFTIASAPTENILRLSIKKSGDYTNLLDKLSKDDLGIITGPYGRIYEDFAFNKDVVCIAGGIGITPFLSLFRSQQVKESKTSKYLFYSVKDLNQAIYDHELEEISKIDPNFKYNLWITSQMGYINAEKIAKIAKDLKNKIIYICGPEQMAFALIDQFKKLGIKNRQIKFEEFSFR